jgi:translation initiation factor 4E
MESSDLDIDHIEQAAIPGPDEHQLQYPYVFWFSQRPQGGVRQTAERYEQNVKPVGCFASVEQFWSYYCHMKRPNDLACPCDIHLFKCGIKPIWEDAANKSGGKWMVRLKKGIVSRCWENLVRCVLYSCSSDLFLLHSVLLWLIVADACT